MNKSFCSKTAGENSSKLLKGTTRFRSMRRREDLLCSFQEILQCIAPQTAVVAIVALLPHQRFSALQFVKSFHVVGNTQTFMLKVIKTRSLAHEIAPNEGNCAACR